MSDTIKITLIIVLWVLLFELIASNRSNAEEEIAQAKQQIAVLSWMIQDEKNNYDIASWAKQECIDSWEIKMNEAHINADKHRAEIKKLEGFIQSRQAQK